MTKTEYEIYIAHYNNVQYMEIEHVLFQLICILLFWQDLTNEYISSGKIIAFWYHSAQPFSCT